MPDKNRLNLLYLNIGRGHPFYLDGICKLLKSDFGNEIDLNIADVNEISGSISRMLWNIIERIYRLGSRGGVVSNLYNIIRQKKNAGKFGLMERILARDVRRYLISKRYPALVSHPILVPMIADMVPVYYQHGEIAAPPEAATHGAKVVFVPSAATGRELVRYGISRDRIIISGLCIESELTEKADEYFHNRIKRLKSNSPALGAFYSSGAEPPGHVKKIILAVESLDRAGQKGIVFCKRGGRLERELSSKGFVAKFDADDDMSMVEKVMKAKNIAMIAFRDREQEHEWTIKLFRYFDYFVAPSHERTNWAAGLGIPMFILHPIIGTFSPLNHKFLLEKGLAYDLENESFDFAKTLGDLRESGRLEDMAINGFGKYSISGFRNIAQYLGSAAGERE